MQSLREQVGFITAIGRVVKLACHFFLGFFRLCLFGRFYSEKDKEKLVRNWSNRLLVLLDIRVDIQGLPPSQFNNMLLVANHVSWLDILIIFTVIKPRFVAKKEIASWPILGAIIKQGDTIFIERDNKRDIMQVNAQIVDALKGGSCVAVFPEGKTSLGLSVEGFKSSLFDTVMQANGRVLPVALQYLNSVSMITTRPSFAGDVSLLRSVWNVLTCYQLTVKVSFEEPLFAGDFLSRGDLAMAARQKIVRHWS